MGKLLLLILLVTVCVCNGHPLEDMSNFASGVQRQLSSGLGLASSIIGGFTSALGLNLGQVGFNTQKRPSYNNEQYPPQNINPEEEGGVSYNYEQQYQPQRPRPPARPPQSHHNSYGPKPPHNRPGYGNQGQHPEYPNNGYNNYNNNPFYTESARPGQHNGENINNNNYGHQYPNNENFGNNPGYNQGSNNNVRPNNGFQGSLPNNNNQFNQNGQERPTDGSLQISNNQGFGNTNQNDYNKRQLLNDIFGTPQNPHSALNVGTQNSNNGLNSGNQYPSNGGLTSGTQNGGFNPGNQYPNNAGITAGSQNLNSGVFNSGNQYPNNGGLITGTQSSGGFNLGDQNSFNQDNVTEKDIFPTFVPLSQTDSKRETETKKPAVEEEEFKIDIRVKDQ